MNRAQRPRCSFCSQIVRTLAATTLVYKFPMSLPDIYLLKDKETGCCSHALTSVTTQCYSSTFIYQYGKMTYSMELNIAHTGITHSIFKLY